MTCRQQRADCGCGTSIQLEHSQENLDDSQDHHRPSTFLLAGYLDEEETEEEEFGISSQPHIPDPSRGAALDQYVDTELLHPCGDWEFSRDTLASNSTMKREPVCLLAPSVEQVFCSMRRRVRDSLTCEPLPCSPYNSTWKPCGEETKEAVSYQVVGTYQPIQPKIERQRFLAKDSGSVEGRDTVELDASHLQNSWCNRAEEACVTACSSCGMCRGQTELRFTKQPFGSVCLCPNNGAPSQTSIQMLAHSWTPPQAEAHASVYNSCMHYQPGDGQAEHCGLAAELQCSTSLRSTNQKAALAAPEVLTLINELQHQVHVLRQQAERRRRRTVSEVTYRDATATAALPDVGNPAG